MLDSGRVENLFVEMRRYVRFGPEDEAALRGLHPHAAPHFRRLAEEWYARLEEHPEALTVFASPEQVARLKGTMVEWLGSLLLGPWDDAYYAHRVRIGQTHVRVALPQRYMLGAMCLIRLSLQQIGRAAIPDQDVRITTTLAVAKILDLELAIMLDSYREAYVDRVQELERL